MKLSWLGHACFACTARTGVTVLLDPYRPDALNGRIRLAPLAGVLTESSEPGPPDVVAVTHYHEDHGWIGGVPGSPQIVDQPQIAAGLRFEMITTTHDGVDGSTMGLNRMIAFRIDGVQVLHPGDIGAVPSDAVLAQLEPTDLLLLPVGGTYTIGPEEAMALVGRLNPRWVVPMHFRSAEVDLPMEPLSSFLSVWPADRPIHRCRTLDLSTPRDPGLYLLEPLAARSTASGHRE